MTPRIAALAVSLFVACVAAAAEPAPVKETVLFDFEDPAELSAWSNLVLPDARSKEPAIKIERAETHATSGKHSLKLTFAGGHWPTITTTRVPDDWQEYRTFKADVTVERTCVVGFTVMQEKSKRGTGWDPGISRWTKTEFLKPGKNSITAPLRMPNDYSYHPKWGKVVRLEIFMYNPHDGEAIHVDNIRLTTENLPATKSAPTEFRVLGTDLTVTGVRDLGKRLSGQWKKPAERTVETVEAEFRARFERLKKENPKAVLAILRDGEKGFDPAHPDRVYAGWKDAYWSSHGPDGLTLERADNRGKDGSHEVFMRHRSPLMRVDFSSIPAGSKILAAELVVVRARPISKEHDAFAKPTMWVAEPCNRPWDEYEVNTYQYSRDKFWKQIGGMDWAGDPDFLPIYVMHGPGGGPAAAWDFTEAVRFWTDGKQPNHGFMLHGDSHDYMTAHTREAAEVKNRPAVLVIYEPK